MLSEHKICGLYWEFNGNLFMDFPHGGSSCPLFPAWIWILNFGFCGGRNTRRPRGKTLGARMRTNGQFLPLCDTCSEIKLRPKYHPSSPSPLYKLLKKREKKKKRKRDWCLTDMWLQLALSPLSPPSLNPLTPTSDQDRISPYNINTMSTR